MAKFGINDILNAKTKAAGQQAQGYKEIYLSPYEVKAAEENTHQKLEGIEELADSFLHVGQEQPTVLATFTEAVFTAAGNICDALAQMFSRQAQAFNVAAEKYKDSEAGAHGE